MTNTWGIHNDQPDIDPLEDGAVRIGWDDVGDLSRLAASRDAFKEALSEKIPEIKESQIPANAGTLYRFVHEIKNGDVILCPDRRTGTVNIGKISGDYKFHPDSSMHNHWRPVTWVRTGVPKSELSQAAQKEIGSRMTLFAIKTAEDEIAHLVSTPSLDDAPDYTWTSFYPDLIDSLRRYREDRGALLEKVWNVTEASGRPQLFKYLKSDKYADESSGPIRDVDPFTILGTFNRGIKEDARAAIAAAYGRVFDVNSPYPTTFPGSPLVNNMSSWFFHWEKERSDHEIDELWDLCSAAVDYAAEANEDTREALVGAFDAAATGDTGRLTMGIFWARPKNFAAYDSRNRIYLSEEFPDLAATLALSSRINGEQFLDNTEKLSAWLANPDSPFKTFSELSYAAWIGGIPKPEVKPPSVPRVDPDSEGEPPVTPTLGDRYSVASIREDGGFVSESDLDAMLERLTTKLNIILQGPPGTGKTWLARRLGWALCDERASARVKVIQFHPSLTYEDFVRGWRPTSTGLELTDGPFLEMCESASRDSENPYVLVIEEVNRGNPAQVFGELLTLIEADKRNPDNGMRLAYPRGNESFFVPSNLHIIGTMNVADRSLAIVDMALRRRFAFIETKPSFGDDWTQYVSGLGYELELLESYGERMRTLNETITNDSALGRQYCIGHSFFTPSKERAETGLDTQQWWRRIVETDIRPLLEEYWFDRSEVAEQSIKQLLGR